MQLVRFVMHQSDLDSDGYLDDAEFSVAIHQIYSWMGGLTLRSILPTELVPKSKQALAIMRELPLRRVTRVFISYRWETPSAKQLALLVRDVLLTQMQYSYVFLDIFDLSGNVADVKVLADRISECHAVVPIWTKGCYDRCLSDPADAVRREVEVALSLRKIIVPVIESSFWDSKYAMASSPDGKVVQVLPPSMKDVLSQIGAAYIHEYPDVMHRKLHRLLQGW